MRVMLINPPPHLRIDQYDTPDFTRLGLACLAATLRADGSVAVEIVDAKFERLDTAGLLARVRAFRPDVVGLTAFTNEIKPAARVAEGIKALSSSIVTVIGGPHLSALPERTLTEFPSFDIGVIGEGDLAFAALVRVLSSGGDPETVGGLVVRGDLGPRRSRGPVAAVDFAALPPPSWDLLPPGRRFLVMTQRGCPYQCTFCQNPNGRLVRKRPIDSVVEELELITERWAPEEVTICDEIFTVDMERTHRLLDAMIARGLDRKVRWWAQTHVNCVSRDLFSKMKAAGCVRVGLGIETGDESILKGTRKGISLRKVLDARAMAREAGLPVEGLFILGHPNETWDSAMRTIRFAVELDPDVPVFSTMVPYPGTRVAELAARGEGGYRLLSTDWNDYINQIGHSLAFEHLSRRQLELLQLLGYVRVFLDNRRFRELATFALRYRKEGLAVVRKILSGRMPRAWERSAEPWDSCSTSE